MTTNTNQPHPTRLSDADADLLDRLLAGEALADIIDADPSGRAEHVSRLLSLLDRWDVPDAPPGLSRRALAGVLCADPVPLSAEDGAALDALLSLRHQGLTDGPMPAGARQRAAGVREVMGLLDRITDEPVPAGLTDKTMQAIEQDRQQQQRRSAASAMTIGGGRQGGVTIRQIVTTAALLLMALSVLLPMLSKGQRDAKIAQCGQNLAGLGVDLQQIAFDHQGDTPRPTAGREPGVFAPLSSFASRELDGSTVPPAQVSFFVLMDQKRIDSQHLTCPATAPGDPAGLYNGQNPVAGGPFRLFVEPRPIFADTNPLYRATPKGLVRDEKLPGLTRSPNHEGIGQNVLISDGSVRWMIRPAVSRDADINDNIWLYQPRNNTDQASDIFLTP